MNKIIAKSTFAAALALGAALSAVAGASVANAADQKSPAANSTLPENVTVIAEVDGCRVYRVEDTTDQPEGQPKIAFMNHVVYFTKCGNLATPMSSLDAGK
ncbi:hypothetical protein [Rhizobium leguminosarum]|uniref:hypothetical protein n=1 Tax=Rhizobium leguminosarum TaxID=384 RepID=UPI002E0D44DB|nr:hypothetical protein U8Q02_40695 [Rhizobium leguminosarum]